MPRFFFHVADGTSTKDADGEKFPSAEAARAHAVQIANELGEDRNYESFAVQVTDERGNEVAHIPIGRTSQKRA
jgi:hypothetical protein